MIGSLNQTLSPDFTLSLQLQNNARHDEQKTSSSGKQIEALDHDIRQMMLSQASSLPPNVFRW